MALPQDYTMLCRWRVFVIQRWLYERNVGMACLEAICLGMDMRRADFLAIVRDYVDASSENQTYGRRK